MKDVTIKEVAKRAGVSIGTVSRVINKANDVKEKNRLKVKAAIDELGFRPNLHAKSLKSNESKIIGIIVGYLSPFSIFGLTLLDEMQKKATQEGYMIVILRTNDDPNLEKKYIEFLWEKRVDGIVINSTGRNEEMLVDISKNGTPVIFSCRRPESYQVDSVRTDQFKSIYMATEHFIKYGHKRIALFNGPKKLVLSTDRFNGFVKALYDYDIHIEKDYIRFGDFNKKYGYESMNWFKNLDLPKRPTAIICCSTSIMYGCLSEMIQHGLSIPEDLSMICLGKPDYEELLQPRITYIDQLNKKVCEATANLIFERINNPSAQNQQIVFTPQLVARGSIKKITVSS